MERMLYADVFFFIFSVELAILGILGSVLLYYLIRISMNIHSVSNSLRTSTEASIDFFARLKERFENNFLFRLLFPKDTKELQGKRPSRKR
jgi:hypothetical protein